ncbi:MAG: DUF423 domain-containing protein [bacterium]|jgi:uncharacterized membrane protein YgdD (TMEM256/DUF423 family)|tara:strand:- start:609 stop:977 length:369 start_codon:yes stop_codon:yes gene_type:complete
MKGYIIIASLFAALAILFGAFGSHALKERLSAQSLEVYDIATRYLMFHALGIFLIALLGFQLPKESLEIPVIMMIVGTSIFSGSLYLIAMLDFKKLGMVTPIGGLLLIVSWLLLAYNTYKTV